MILSLTSLVVILLAVESGSWIYLHTWGIKKGNRQTKIILPAQEGAQAWDSGKLQIPSTFWKKATHASDSRKRREMMTPPDFEYSSEDLEPHAPGHSNNGMQLNTSHRMRVFNRTEGVPLFEQSYIFDEYQRRIGFKMDSSRAEAHALTLGCSQTLGEGIAADSTFAAQLARKSGGLYRPYILAQGGAHAGQILALARHHRGFKNITPSRGFAVILIFGFHFRRMLHSLVEGHGIRHSVHPSYGPEGRVDVTQTFEQTSPWRLKIQNWLWSTYFRKAIGLDYPFYYGKEDMEMMADILMELKDSYQETTSRQNPFIVLLGEANQKNFWRPFYTELDKRGLRYVDYGNVKVDKISDRDVFIHSYNMHYTPHFHEIFAQQVLEDIGPLLKEKGLPVGH